MANRSDTPSTAIDLAQTVGPLRRALLKSAQSAGGLPALPEAQIEVLRLVVEAGSLSSAVIADRLGLARPTVSNLLKSMTSAGLIERTVANDLRSTLVGASAHARDLLERYDDVSARVVADAMERLEPLQRECLGDAASALRALAAVLAVTPQDEVQRED